jgi:hypothetical protein
MKEIYLFNPDNDLALANGDTNYIPPKAARWLARDLAMLPAWYAPAGAAILAAGHDHSAWLLLLKERFGLQVNLLTEEAIGALSDLSLCPWGWNIALRKRLMELGMAKTLLPSDRFMLEIKRLSHRSVAVNLLPELQLDGFFCGESAYLSDGGEIERQVMSYNHGFTVLKAPLSGSGKGLFWCNGEFTPPMRNWCERIIRRQGGVAVEPQYRRVTDFAMEFLSANGAVTFAGYSLFHTTSSGAYTGNLLLSDQAIELKLSELIPIDRLHALKSRLELLLTQLLASSYSGYLGIDMMICAFDTLPYHRIHPCVELNLRMNMGVVSRIFYDRYIDPQSEGSFQIEYYTAPALVEAAHRTMEWTHPLQTAAGRIISGYLPLVPVTPESRYRAWVLVEPAGSHSHTGLPQ